MLGLREYYITLDKIPKISTEDSDNRTFSANLLAATDSEKAHIRQLLGKCEHEYGDHSSALESYNASLGLYPEDSIPADLFYDLGVTHIITNNWEEGEMRLGQAIERNPRMKKSVRLQGPPLPEHGKVPRSHRRLRHCFISIRPRRPNITSIKCHLLAEYRQLSCSSTFSQPIGCT